MPEVCARHKGEPITVFSLLHEKCMCLKCAMVEHDQLTDFVPISEGVRRIRKDGKALLDDITTLSDTVQRVKGQRDADYENIIHSEKRIRATIRKIKDQFTRKLDLMEQKVINKVKLLVTKNATSLGNDQQSLRILQSDLKKMGDRLTKVLKSNSDIELIRSVISEKNALEERSVKIRDQEEKKTIKNIDFDIANAVQNFLDTVEDIGEVTVDGVEQTEFMKKSVGFVKTSGSVETLSLRSVGEGERVSPFTSPGRVSRNKYGIHTKSVYRPKEERLVESDSALVNFISDEDYLVRSGHVLLTAKHESPCNITGIAALSNGRVVACDAKHKCIQLLNRRSKVIDYLLCRNKPCDIDSISDHSVVISFYEKDYISIFNTSDFRLIHLKDLVISGRGGSYSIAHDNGKFAVCRRGEVKIVSGETGRLINTVEIEYHFPKIAMADSKLYLSDFVGGKVTCMTDLGKVKWEYGRDEFEPSGVAIESDLNKLFVCDVKGTVTVLSTYGVLLRDISSPGHLNAICVDPWTGTVLVSQESRDKTKSRELKIIQT